IWISPIYPSPMDDFGYDISNHCDIHPMFGDLATFDHLVEEAHARDLKVIMDYVPNHTSNQHPWFLESKSSRTNSKADWYIWKDPKPDGSVPNNWLSLFGGESAWEWSPEREQYYLHTFLVEQPDVNWRNPEARQAMLDILHFWFKRGIDGLRIDASIEAMKDPEFRDEALNPDWHAGIDPFLKIDHTYSQNTVHNHQMNRWLREVSDQYADRFLVGETYLHTTELVEHYGNDDEFHIPYNFQLIMDERWQADVVKGIADEYDAAVPEGAQPSWVLGNHDRHRVATRVGSDQARVAMTLLLTLRGTPTIYYGDEMGMEDVEIPAEKEIDPWGILAPGLGLGRDPERTPMQWDDSPNSGFSEFGVEPWLPIADNFEEINVKTGQIDPQSMLNMTRELLHLRRAMPALNHGSYRSLEAPDGIFAYVREAEGQSCLVVLNMTAEEANWVLPNDIRLDAEKQVIFSTHTSTQTELNSQTLLVKANQAVILAL
ncbi:MAG: alpha-amylase family glycosyl hydrolase, partial [Chloroflexota bacterium]